MPKIVYWDACVFHAIFGSEKGRVEPCMRIEKAAQNGEVVIYTSAATFVECVWVKSITDPTGKLNKLSPEHEQVIEGYFRRSYIIVINCDRNIAEAARKLLWKYPLKPKDAIHVASAMAQQVDVMHSYDNDDLVKLDRKIGNPPLKICNPGVGDGFEAQIVQGDAFPSISAPPAASLPPLLRPPLPPPPEEPN
jgi:predicted nucleic acid-binding protein